jgi:FixJ family two-component response regulator
MKDSIVMRYACEITVCDRVAMPRLLKDVSPTDLRVNQARFSIKTIETHRSSLKEKLQLQSDAGLVRCAEQWLESQ